MLRIDVNTANDKLSVEVEGSTEDLIRDFSVAATAVYAVMSEKDQQEAEVFHRGICNTLGNFDSRTWASIMKCAGLMVEGGYENFSSDS